MRQLMSTLMTALTALLLVTAGTGIAMACGGNKTADRGDQATTDAPATAVVSIDGMTCGSCAASVRSALYSLTGVQSVSVDLDKANATIGYDPKTVKPTALVAAIETAGYSAKLAGKKAGKAGKAGKKQS